MKEDGRSGWVSQKHNNDECLKSKRLPDHAQIDSNSLKWLKPRYAFIQLMGKTAGQISTSLSMFALYTLMITFRIFSYSVDTYRRFQIRMWNYFYFVHRLWPNWISYLYFKHIAVFLRNFALIFHNWRSPDFVSTFTS